jgi:DDE superfamily endonuclease
LDGTDCPIREPQPFNPKYYTKKFNGPGLRYEIAICINTGWIVWYNGPFPCGGCPDIEIARVGICHYLLPGEKILADKGYRDGGQYFITPDGRNGLLPRMRSLCRARHETVNGRLKVFSILSTPFRHPLGKHHKCFYTIITITQIYIMLYETNFDVFYDENI